MKYMLPPQLCLCVCVCACVAISEHPNLFDSQFKFTNMNQVEQKHKLFMQNNNKFSIIPK